LSLLISSTDTFSYGASEDPSSTTTLMESILVPVFLL